MPRVNGNNIIVSAVLLGDAKVGKTTLLQPAERVDQKYEPTIGVGFDAREYTDINTKLQIWDVSGNPKYWNIIQTYFHERDAGIFCVSLADHKSLESIAGWVKKFRARSPQAICVLLATHADVPEEKRAVTLQELENCATSLKIEFNRDSCVVNAQDKTQTDALFQIVVDLIPKPVIKEEKKPKACCNCFSWWGQNNNGSDEEMAALSQHDSLDNKPF